MIKALKLNVTLKNNCFNVEANKAIQFCGLTTCLDIDSDEKVTLNLQVKDGKIKNAGDAIWINLEFPWLDVKEIERGSIGIGGNKNLSFRLDYPGSIKLDGASGKTLDICYKGLPHISIFNIEQYNFVEFVDIEILTKK